MGSSTRYRRVRRESGRATSLQPGKWNKDKKDGSWRMDVDIDVENAVDDESDEEDEVEFDDDDFESEEDCSDAL
jgi:hypothetical protein